MNVPSFFPGGRCTICGGECVTGVDVVVSDATHGLFDEEKPNPVWRHVDPEVCKATLS